MPLRLLAPGSGLSRPLVVLFHFAGGSAQRPMFIDDRIRAAVSPVACIVGYTAPVPPGGATTGGAYRQIGATGSDGVALPDVAGVVAWAAAHGAPGVGGGPVLACGFSEGCQGVRAWLGQPLTGLLAVDGVHASKPPDVATQIAPWTAAGARARSGEVPATFTYSQIDPPGYLSVRETLRIALDVEPLPPGAGIEAGALRVGSYAGNDAAAHARQLQQVLPLELLALATRLGFGGDPAALAALLGGASGPRPAFVGAPPGPVAPASAPGISTGLLVAGVLLVAAGSVAVERAPAELRARFGAIL
jgi:hypothetical protein